MRLEPKKGCFKRPNKALQPDQPISRPPVSTDTKRRNMTHHNGTRTLGAILYKNFELLDLFGPLEMFGNIVPGIKIVTVAEQPGPVRSAQGPKTVAEYGFGECPRLDLILLPGGIGTLEQFKNPAVLNFLRNVRLRLKSPCPFAPGPLFWPRPACLTGGVPPPTNNSFAWPPVRATGSNGLPKPVGWKTGRSQPPPASPRVSIWPWPSSPGSLDGSGRS